MTETPGRDAAIEAMAKAIAYEAFDTMGDSRAVFLSGLSSDQKRQSTRMAEAAFAALAEIAFQGNHPHD